ncbi:hypothetical protein [Flavobacterium sp.]|uniref:hypothetical protein n=1 Tax=Flavobacterium sp. TaxID=239 RepID=UPI00122AB2AC|nr:hypothetical protein [Flavobacterium sp.]RZJ69794.1 MAG: hypothetical protein EOO49_16165 [Flavobacterium sp.]
MKKLLYLFAIAGMTTLAACDGDTGPQGAPGPEAQVYETNPVDFTAAGNYGVFYNFPSGALLSSDHVLVYRLSAVDNGVDVWKPLPETFYFNDGTLDFMYGFDHTQYDVNIYMEGFDLGAINGDFRLGQIFRIVSIPGTFSGKNAVKVDLNNYDAVIKAYNIDESKMKSITLQAKTKA